MKPAKTRDMALVAVGAVIIVISALITIPSVIPFTMQSFGVAFVLLAFGGKRGTLSVLVYLALGAFGVPVFSGFGAGFGVLFGPTGGFLLGFLAFALLYLLFEVRFQNSTKIKLLSLCLGMLVCYASGTAFYMLWGASNSTITFGSAVMTCVVPNIIPDAIKLLFAYSAYERIGKLS